MPNTKKNLDNNPNPIIQKLSTINQTSNIIPTISYPFIECYINCKHVITNEYPIRSAIRATANVGSLVAGPLLVEIGNFTWLKDRSFSLYQTIPVFNQLPETAGTLICSAYICSYFLTWSANQVTNFFTYYKFGGTEHYLTPDKAQKIYDLMKNNQFNISIDEIMDIFSKINEQLRKDPNNKKLIELVNCIRNGDLQSILDNAHLLETEIALVNNKINILSNNQVDQEQISPAMEPSTSLLPLTCNAEESNAPPPSPFTQINNATSSTDPLSLTTNIEDSNNPHADPNREQHTDPLLYDSEEEHPDRKNPPIPAIMYQYQQPHKSKRAVNLNISVDKLKKHRDVLKTKRVVDPKKTFKVVL